MPRKCSICAHPKKRWIDQALLKGAAVAKVARKYGVSSEALRRHKHNHLSKQIAKVEERTGKTFVERFEDLYRRLVEIAKDAKSTTEKIACLREERGLLEMAVKLGMEEQRRRDQQTFLDVTPGVKEIIDKEFEK